MSGWSTEPESDVFTGRLTQGGVPSVSAIQMLSAHVSAAHELFKYTFSFLYSKREAAGRLTQR